MKTTRLLYFIAILLFFHLPIISFGQKEGNFELTFCDETIKDGGIIDVFIIDSIGKDTISGSALLQGGFVNLDNSHTYTILLIGKKKWNYFSELNYFRGYPGSNKIRICFNCKAKYRKRVTESDWTVSSWYRIKNGYSNHIMKKKK